MVSLFVCACVQLFTPYGKKSAPLDWMNNSWVAVITTLKEKYKFPFPPFDPNDKIILKLVQSFKFSSKF